MNHEPRERSDSFCCFVCERFDGNTDGLVRAASK